MSDRYRKKPVADRLRAMVEAATPGPWEFSDASDVRGRKGEFRALGPYNGFMLVGPWTNDADARLMALAPDLASLLADAVTLLRHPAGDSCVHFYGGPCFACDCRALLARVAETLGEDE